MITAHIPPSLRDRVHAFADEHDRTVSWIVGEALRQIVDPPEQPEPMTAAERRALSRRIRQRKIGAGEGSQHGEQRPEPTSAAPPPPVPCTHPKAALVKLAGGLARCGACGTNRRADGTWP